MLSQWAHTIYHLPLHRRETIKPHLKQDFCSQQSPALRRTRTISGAENLEVANIPRVVDVELHRSPIRPDKPIGRCTVARFKVLGHSVAEVDVTSGKRGTLQSGPAVLP